MINKEHELMCSYMYKILKSKKSSRAILSLVCSWVWDNAEDLNLDVEDPELYDLLTNYPKAFEEKEVSRDLYIETRQQVIKLLQSKKTKNFTDAHHDYQNLNILANSLNLDSVDIEIFSIFYRYATNDPFESFIDQMSKRYFTSNEIISALTGFDRKTIVEKTSREGRLVQMGLLHPEGSTSGYLQNCFSIPPAVKRGLQSATLGKDDLHHHFLGKSSPSTLSWEDFEHIGGIRDQLASFIKKSVQKQERGINILLWGDPGTGKTEFCKTLATYLEIELFSICEADEDGKDPSREERLDALKLAQSLLREQNTSMLLFDEMDDLLASDSERIFAPPRKLSKVFVNRIFEQNPIPTIWTLNDIDLLDEAILRRMSLAIEFRKPPRKNRERILTRILQKHDLELSKNEMSPLLNAEVAPAILDSAVRYAEISEEGTEGLNFALKGLTQALGAKTEHHKPSEQYIPELVNSEIDLKELTGRLVKNGNKNFSLCLYGPSGTGKSEYARYLAESLDMEPQIVRTSDLKRPYVGESEMMIAKAFRTAREQGTFLIFDEADSLLSDRRQAVRSWEISQVNEMLTWMENHPLPFVCTTNLKEQLDQASMRRFTFKCCFDYLTPEQTIIAFEHFFKLDIPPVKSTSLHCLTPGDFAVVRKKLEYLNINDSKRIIEMLHQEIESKNEPAKPAIGFFKN